MGGRFDLERIRGYDTPEKRFAEAMAAFENDDIRTSIGTQMKVTFKEKGYPVVHVAESIGIDKALMSKYLNGKRPFAIPCGALVELGTKYLNMSAHEIMFGEPAITILPRHLSVIAKAMKSAGVTIKEDVAEAARAWLKRERTIGETPNRACEEISATRILELAEDKYTNPIFLLDESAALGAKMPLKKNLHPENPVSARPSKYMYYAMELGTSLDYFIAEDYTAFAAIGYRDGDGIVEAAEKPARDFVSCYLRLSDESQLRTLSEVYKLLFPA